MNKSFYPKLAWTGMRSNRKLYLPYLITCISMVAMLYIVGYLSGAQAVRHLPGGQFIQEMLGLGDWNMLDPVSTSILEHLQTMTEEERVMTLRFIHSLKDFREAQA